MNLHAIRITTHFIPLLAALLLAGGCATTRQPIQLPYAFPAAVKPAPAAASVAPTAEIVQVTDTREDRSLDMFLNERPTEFLRKALAAELEAAGAFARVALHEPTPAAAPIAIDLELKDLSWTVPNHKAMVKTAFWTSLLTGGLGGLAYGSTETPVFGHAVLVVKITERASGRVLFSDKIETLHEEKMAKLKSDSLETRARMMAAAMKTTLTKATAAALKACAPHPSTPPAPAEPAAVTPAPAS